MTYDLVKNTFQRNNASAYQLSILTGVDSLVYSVTDTETKELLVLKTVDFSGVASPAGRAEILRKENLLDLLYRKVKVAMFYPASALVPARLFNEEEHSTYLGQLSLGKIEGKPQNDTNERLELRVIYPPKTAYGVMLAQRFPTGKFYHSITPFLQGCAEMTKNGKEHTAFVHFFEHSFYCSIFEKERLLFCNTFEYHTASDVMYFTLTAFEQYGISAETVQLFLSGKVVQDSDIYKMLYRYVLHLDILPAVDFVKMDGKFTSVSSHFYFPLHALALL